MSGFAPLVVTATERTFGPCPKCESAEVGVTYHEGAPRHCLLCPVKSCKYSKVCGDDGREGEHLVVRCSRCRFGWVEEVSK